MKTYRFEYSNEKRLKTSILVGFGIFLGIAAVVVFTVQNELQRFILVLLGLLVASIFFYLNARTIKQVGTALLVNDHLLLNVFGDKIYISFHSIENYSDGSRSDEAYLKLLFKDGRKFLLAANPNFCNVNGFKTFMADTTQALQQFNETQPASLQVKEARHPLTTNNH